MIFPIVLSTIAGETTIISFLAHWYKKEFSLFILNPNSFIN